MSKSDDAGVALEDAVGVKETDHALLVRLAGGEEKWIPLSCLHDDSEVFGEDHVGRLVLKTWFAEKEGLG